MDLGSFFGGGFGASNRSQEARIKKDQLAGTTKEHAGEGDKDRELSDLQKQYASLQQAYSQSESERQRVMALTVQDMREISALREKQATLQERNAALERALQACKDDLFRMQPRTQVSDSTIAQRFEHLNDQICDWIDNEISRSMDECQSIHPGTQPKLFHHDEDPTTKGFLAHYPDTGGEYIIRFMLHFAIQRKLLSDQIFLFHLDTTAAKYLKYVEKGMTQLQPPKDAATIRLWRSETLTSIVGTPDFSAGIRNAGCQLATEIFDFIEDNFPIIRGKTSSLQCLYDRVVALAVDLAITVQTSPAIYHFEPRMSMSSMFKRSAVSKTHLGYYRMIEVATGKTLKADSPVTPDGKGDIGDQILVLSPALSRRDADRFIPLSQAVILVELYYPLGRRRGTIVEPEG